MSKWENASESDILEWYHTSLMYNYNQLAKCVYWKTCLANLTPSHLIDIPPSLNPLHPSLFPYFMQLVIYLELENTNERLAAPGCNFSNWKLTYCVCSASLGQPPSSIDKLWWIEYAKIMICWVIFLHLGTTNCVIRFTCNIFIEINEYYYSLSTIGLLEWEFLYQNGWTSDMISL